MVIKSVVAFYVRVNNLERSKAFYEKILGVSFVHNSPQIAMAKLGDLTIVLQESKIVGLTTAVTFAVEDLDETIEIVTGEGGKINQSITKGPLGFVANLTDPDGIPLEFVQLDK